MNKPLNEVSITELLEVYGRVINALAQYDYPGASESARFLALMDDRRAIEDKAKRRDTERGWWTGSGEQVEQ